MVASLEEEKEAAGRAAASRVEPGMRVALGTGTTAAYAIRELARRFAGSGSIRCVASSNASEELARGLGLECHTLGEDDRFDLMVDGTDEITPRLDLTKGGGGALLREKLLARLSRELVIAADHTKLVGRLGERRPVPVEVVPYASPAVLRWIGELAIEPSLRRDPAGRPVRTDNGNWLIDLRPKEPIREPARLDAELRRLTGVVETGLFVGLARRAFLAEPTGGVAELRAPTGAADP